MNYKLVIFTGIGLVLLLLHSYSLYQSYKFSHHSATTNGYVSKLNAGGSHPEITFTTKDGQTISYPQNGLIFGYKVNDKVEVLYNPNTPTEATIKSFGAQYGFEVLGLFLSLFFIIFGIFV